jgi:hypothetical protein
MTKPRIILLAAAFCLSQALSAQSLLDAIPGGSGGKIDEKAARLDFMKQPLMFFKAPRLIAFNTVECVPKGELNSRIGHRFGNAGDATKAHTLFGLDNAADIWLGVDYGVTDNFQIGIARTKGAGAARELWSASGKVRLPGNHIGSLPIRMALAGNATMSTQYDDPFGTGIPMTHQNFAHRVSYYGQFLFAFAPKGKFVFQIAPAFLYRNYVADGDANGVIAVPISGRLKLSKRFSLTAEYAPQVSTTSETKRDGSILWKGSSGIADGAGGFTQWYAPLQVAMEIETGGHVFQVSLSNSSGLLENDMLGYSTSSWQGGGYRMGFSFTRGFQVR